MPDRKKFLVFWARNALCDLDSILSYLVSENIDDAGSILEKIQGTASRLTSFPYRGRIVPELKEQGVLGYHELIHPPWRIVYKIEKSAVSVVAVIDGRRNFEDLLLERFLAS